MHKDYNKLRFESASTISKLRTENIGMKSELNDLHKKLFKLKDVNIADLDPVEMHRKLRLVQSRLELSERHNFKIEEKLKDINDVFKMMGITLDDLK